MANTLTAANLGGLSRGKAVSITGLAVVLIGVLYVQYGHSGSAVSDAESTAHKSRRTLVAETANSAAVAKTDTKAPTPNDSASAVAAAVDETRWKSPKLVDVVNYDPFALPATFPKPRAIDPSGANAEGLVAAAAAEDAKKLADAIAQLQTQLQALKERGVQVIVRERDQYVAMIGDRTLHVGDEINGFTVTGIDPGGVVVERKASQ